MSRVRRRLDADVGGITAEWLGVLVVVVVVLALLSASTLGESVGVAVRGPVCDLSHDPDCRTGAPGEAVALGVEDPAGGRGPEGGAGGPGGPGGARVGATGLDLDGDGRPDVNLVDPSGLGDPARVDLDGDGRADGWAVDRDGDGRADAAAVDVDGDGVPDRIVTDEGGTVVAVSDDRDPDGHYVVAALGPRGPPADDGDDGGGGGGFWGSVGDALSGAASAVGDGLTWAVGGVGDIAAVAGTYGGAFVNGFAQGDFRDEAYSSGWMEGFAQAGQLVSGILVVGDIRDAIAAGGEIIGSGGRDGWGNLGMAALGAVPIAGDIAKGVKGGRAVTRVVDAAAESADAVRRGSRAADAVVAAGRVDEFVQSSSRTVGSSRRLRRNMNAFADVHRAFRDPGNVDAHHIVPLGHRDAEDAREILEQFGIHIDSAANGVFLPRSVRNADGTVRSSNANAPGRNHSRLNSTDYIERVNLALQRADSRESAIRELENLRGWLRSGVFE